MNMKTTRRAFMQVLGALGLSVSVPVVAQTTPWSADSFDQARSRMNRPTEGKYYLMKLHREHTARMPIFYPMPPAMVQEALNTYGVRDGDFVWIKLAVFKRPGIMQAEGDTLTKDVYEPVGGMAIRFASHVSMMCENGKVLYVSKNKCMDGRDFHDPAYPSNLHLSSVKTLTPMRGLHAEYEPHFLTH